MDWERLWEAKEPGAAALRAALWPASLLYAAGWEAYAATYRLGLKRAREPHRPVVCVGNLRVGGSGKTPATRAVARALTAIGRDVAVSCSGYGSPASESASLAPEGYLDAAVWGDEPAEMRILEPSLPLVVGRDRVRAAEIVHERFPGHVMLMDDGFQHLRLKVHLSLLLDSDGGNALCLPAGPYREPRRHRSRASEVLPGRFRVEYGPMGFYDQEGRPAYPVRVAVLTAIARPERLLASLSDASVEVAAVTTLPDHDPLAAGNLFEGLPADVPIAVTLKDWVKLRERPDLEERQVITAVRSAEIEPRASFAEFLRTSLDGLEQTQD